MRSTCSPAAMRPASRVAVRCSSLKLAGTVITTCEQVLPRLSSATARARRSTNALISGSE
jgi:hypothetical protein